jgi:hypothetical protein
MILFSLFVAATLGITWILPAEAFRPPVHPVVARQRPLDMKLVGISKKRLLSVIPRRVTTEQIKSYWGNNPKVRLQKILESFLVSYGGLWGAWFLSFMAGNYVAAFMGTFLCFNWMYTPWLHAKKRNAKMWPATGEKIYYALFMGRIKQLKRVKRRAGKSIGAVAQEYLLLLMEDEKGRELEVVTQWESSHKNLRKDMRCHTVISSLDRDFASIFMVADLWAPSCDVWIGDYPYLNQQEFRRCVVDATSQGAAGGGDSERFRDIAVSREGRKMDTGARSNRARAGPDTQPRDPRTAR